MFRRSNEGKKGARAEKCISFLRSSSPDNVQVLLLFLMLHDTSRDSGKSGSVYSGLEIKLHHYWSIFPPLVLETACQAPFPRSFVSVERTLVVAENFHVHDVHSVHIIASRSQLIVAHCGLLGLTEGRQPNQ